MMMDAKKGFSVIEFMVGSAFLVLLLFAASNMLKPLNQSTKKARILNSMIKLEGQIRQGVYLQPSYSDLSKFEIIFNDKVVAKHGQLLYVAEDLSDSSADPIYPLISQLEVVPFTVGAVSQLGVIYRVASDAKDFSLHALGTPSWPTSQADKEAFLKTQFAGFENGASYAAVTIPKRLVESTLQECTNGFVRGVSSDKTVKCWQLSGPTTCPAWSIPVGYQLNDATSSVEILCQELNRISCPAMDMSIVDADTGLSRSLNLNNFFVLKKFVLADLFQARNISVAASECERVVDFSVYNPQDASGGIPASIVLSNSVNGQITCPDSNLYRKNPDNSCSPNFQLSNIPLRKPASLLLSPLNIKAAGAP